MQFSEVYEIVVGKCNFLMRLAEKYYSIYNVNVLNESYKV